MPSQNSLLFQQVPYDVNIAPFGTNTRVNTDCNSLLFINQGTNVCVIDYNLTLVPGAKFGVDGNFLERLTRQFQITFIDTGGFNKLVVIQKTYQ